MQSEETMLSDFVLGGYKEHRAAEGILSLLVQAMALRKESIGSRQLAQDGVQGYSLVFW